jgi:hypothetical protein
MTFSTPWPKAPATIWTICGSCPKPSRALLFAVDIDLGKPEKAQRTETLFTQAGAQVEAAGTVLKISGDLGAVLLKSVNDADLLFNNQGEKLQAQYNFSGREVVRTWWESLNKVSEALTKQQAFKQAKGVSEIQKRGPGARI